MGRPPRRSCSEAPARTGCRSRSVRGFVVDQARPVRTVRVAQ
ncbi:hypothetical protein DB32_000456 [Sandaracinus amylolyticus]|uniref:Uncharacterized protein n=1 Tax=Sandaracinus amylolyticus TaxID=927083 RepID=A0A0F6YG65_9BACT|nr:hypothetical protein DB32_000456 [Sandaracinus amylolyticus]